MAFSLDRAKAEPGYTVLNDRLTGFHRNRIRPIVPTDNSENVFHKIFYMMRSETKSRQRDERIWIAFSMLVHPRHVFFVSDSRRQTTGRLCFTTDRFSSFIDFRVYRHTNYPGTTPGPCTIKYRTVYLRLTIGNRPMHATNRKRKDRRIHTDCFLAKVYYTV